MNYGLAVSASPSAVADALAAFDVKNSVRVIATSNLTLSGLQTVDGKALNEGDPILCAGQTDGTQNGPYLASASAWQRRTDADSSAELTAGTCFYVEEGSATNADSVWALTTDNPITLGITSLTFTKISGLGQVTAGTGLTKSGNTVSLDAANLPALTSTGLITATGFAPTPQAPAYAASVALDANKQHHDIGKLTGNLTVTFTNEGVGKSLTFSVKQDATGSRTVTITPPAGYTLEGDVGWGDSNPQPGANTRTLYTILFYTQDGTNYCGWQKSFRV